MRPQQPALCVCSQILHSLCHHVSTVKTKHTHAHTVSHFLSVIPTQSTVTGKSSLLSPQSFKQTLFYHKQTAVLVCCLDVEGKASVKHCRDKCNYSFPSTSSFSLSSRLSPMMVCHLTRQEMSSISLTGTTASSVSTRTRATASATTTEYASSAVN